jgi:Outer membrane receptor for ferrienterochelin and colicins
LKIQSALPWVLNGAKKPTFRKPVMKRLMFAGPYALEPPLGLNQGFSIGSNGFPGYQPQSAGHWSRNNWALYADVELFVTEDWQFGMATRVEHFSDFGSTFDGKVSTRYKLNDLFALRGSVNTGFKATHGGSKQCNQCYHCLWNKRVGGPGDATAYRPDIVPARCNATDTRRVG